MVLSQSRPDNIEAKADMVRAEEDVFREPIRARTRPRQSYYAPPAVGYGVIDPPTPGVLGSGFASANAPIEPTRFGLSGCEDGSRQPYRRFRTR